jgi:hypothetical protein
MYVMYIMNALVLLGKYLGTKKSGHLYANCDTMDEKTTFFFYLINRWGRRTKQNNLMISSLDKAEVFDRHLRCFSSHL